MCVELNRSLREINHHRAMTVFGPAKLIVRISMTQQRDGLLMSRVAPRDLLSLIGVSYGVAYAPKPKCTPQTEAFGQRHRDCRNEA
jgi:hypothetical protein